MDGVTRALKWLKHVSVYVGDTDAEAWCDCKQQRAAVQSAPCLQRVAWSCEKM